MQLLVSVRSAEEAAHALEGGAELIDVKEPSRGPLGAADPEVIAAVVATVAGRCPVSAALGELHDSLSLVGPPSRGGLECRSARGTYSAGLQYVKWGLAEMFGRPWQDAFQSASQLPAPTPVLAAYADAEHARAPAVDDVLAFACAQGVSVFLIDTFDKSPGRTLLSYLSTTQIAHICDTCRAHDIRIALAGSLGPAEIDRLLPARPDWFAVRGAACTDRARTRSIDVQRVRELAQLLH